MILPHRIMDNVKSHLIYTLALIIIVIVGLPMFQTLFYVLWDGNVILSAIVVFLAIGFFYALPEKIHLDRDGEQMRQFRRDTPDGTYDMKKDAIAFLKSPEFFSDCIAILCLVIAAILIIVAMIMLRIIAPPVMVVIMENPAILLVIPPAAVILSLTYGLFHLIFTVQVHRDWDETRLHLENEKKMEYTDKKK